MSLGSRFWVRHKKIYLGAGFLLLALSVLTFAGPNLKASADCSTDNNAILRCGFSSSTDFINKVNANNSLNGHTDLKTIYANYGLVPAQYANFARYAEAGTAVRANNTIIVNKQVVATGTYSIGRIAAEQGSNYRQYPIPGAGTFYGNTNSQAFASTNATLPVMVLFDAGGKMLFAVIDTCGNPIFGTPVTPTARCTALTKTPVSGQANTYTFRTSASASNNATIVKIVYDFGDGSPEKVTTSTATTVTHTYTTSGNFKATVKVYVSIPGNPALQIDTTNCFTMVSAALPYYRCVVLTPGILPNTPNGYSFVATGSYGGGATLTNADFDFGNGHSISGVAANGSTVTTAYTYPVAGSDIITAVLHFSLNGSTVSAAGCTASVSPTQPPTSDCYPGIPTGSPLCKPCASNAAYPASDTTHCVVPVAAVTPTTTLVNTGAGDVIAVFGAAVIGGFIIFRQIIYRRNNMAGTHAGSMPFGHHLMSHPHHVSVADPLPLPGSHAAAHHTAPHAHSVHHNPTYHKPNRFRPGKNTK